MLSLGYVHLGNLTIVGFAQNTSSIYTMRILHFWIRLISFHFKTCSAETILKEKSYFQRIIWNITWNICIFVTSHNIIPNIKWILKKRMIGILWWHALYKNKKIFVPNSVFVILFLGCLPTHHASNRIILVAHSLQQNEKLSGAMRRATSRINSLSI